MKLIQPKSLLQCVGVCLALAMTPTVYASSVSYDAPNTTKADISKQKHGITVWRVPFAQSPVDGFKVTGKVQANIEDVYDLIVDIDTAHEWIPNTISAVAINRDENDNGEVYAKINLPFPAKDRDVVMRVDIHRVGADKIIIKNTGIDEKLVPENSKFIRVKNYKCDWLLEKIGDNSTQVTMFGYADPSGSLPKWVVNRFITDQPFGTLYNMRTQLQKK